jgi:hypothetical protein
MNRISQRQDCYTITLNDLFRKWVEEEEVFKYKRTFGEYFCLYKYDGWIIL